jgi:hypothetical protein
MYYNSMYYANNDEYLTQSPQLYDTEAHDCFNIPYFFLTEILVFFFFFFLLSRSFIKWKAKKDL